MIELTFLKELMLIRQANQKSAIIATNGIFFTIYIFKFQPDVCDRCHDVLMMFMNLSDIGILNTHSVDYRCIITGISKSEAINVRQNINLTENGTLPNMKKWCVKTDEELIMFGDIEI